MSLHRYLVSPPLAIAIAPAKPHPPPRTEKKSDPQDKDKEKDKVQGQAKQEENKIQDPNPDPGPKADADPAKPQIDGAIKAAGIPLHIPNAGPTTPVSMIPEPPTPADGIVVDADAKPPTPDDPIFKPKDQPDETKLEAIDVTPDGKPKDNLVHKADEVKADKPEAVKPKNDPENKPKEPFIGPLPKPESDEVELIPEPLRLIGPPPKYPIRTILDLNPSHPWPPIESDPRGAYHHYAKGCYRGLIESVYIDVTKDGWMSGHWKDKSERDALAKLRGEDLRKARRELEWQGRLTEGRKVPKSAGDVLLCLWNLLVEAPNNELPTETFWASFNWDDPAAQVHTKQIPLEDMNANKSITIDGEEVEWTKAGVEQILATVGIQCVYKSDVPIGRRYTDRWPGAFGQDRAFIILGHNHFMLRLREWLEFKPEDTVGKFEVLVVSGHDRILGNMVKEQRMAERKKEEIEYYKRKKAQKEKAEAEAEAMAKGEKKSDDEVIPDGKKEGKGKGEKSDTSTKQVKDGREMVKPSEVKVDEKLEVKAEGQEKVEEGKLMVAIPIKTDGVKGEVGLDAKHDQIAMLAAPGEAAAAKAEAEAEAKAQADVANGGDGKDGDQVKKGEQKAEKNEDKKEEKQVRDPMRDAERIAKMMGNTGNLKMEDIQIALKVLEAASDKENRKKDSKEDVGLLWTWGESCERWRWANYEAGVHEVGLGGWEERDWKVFADDRGVEEFEDDMGKAEGLEEDVHDWSC